MKRFAGVLVVVSFLVACNKDKDEAMKVAADIDAACKAGEKDKAAKLGSDLYGKNGAFKKAVDGAAETWKVSDPGEFNYCGPGFIEVKSRLEL